MLSLWWCCTFDQPGTGEFVREQSRALDELHSLSFAQGGSEDQSGPAADSSSNSDGIDSAVRAEALPEKARAGPKAAAFARLPCEAVTSRFDMDQHCGSERSYPEVETISTASSMAGGAPTDPASASPKVNKRPSDIVIELARQLDDPRRTPCRRPRGLGDTPTPRTCSSRLMFGRSRSRSDA